MSKISNKPVVTLAKETFMLKLKESRSVTSAKIEHFKFNKSRCHILSECSEVKDGCGGIIYWMSRDCRVQDNWAMLFSQKLATKNKVPLHVCFFSKPTSELYPTKRHYNFLLNGLKEVKSELKDLNISFHLINTEPHELVRIVKENNIGAVVCEFHPLRLPRKWQNDIRTDLPEDVAFVEVDAHNIVPVRKASEKKELAARTIRPKINKVLDEYLEPFPYLSEQEDGGVLKIDKEVIIQLPMLHHLMKIHVSYFF